MNRLGVYRVRVSHADPEHHMNAEAFYGPAFDAGYQHTVTEAIGQPVDLVAHARLSADRCRAEHPDADDYTTRVVELVQVDGEPEASWEEV